MKFSELIRSNFYTSEPQDVAKNDCKFVRGLNLQKEMTIMTNMCEVKGNAISFQSQVE